MGCAKNLLFGKFAEPGIQQGASSPILDKDEIIGYAFRSKAKQHKYSYPPIILPEIDNCLQIIKQYAGKYRIPDPTKLAHGLVNRFRKGDLNEGYHKL